MTDNGTSPSLPPEVRVQRLILRQLLNTKAKPSPRPENLDHMLRPLAALHEVVLVCESILNARRAPGEDDRRSLKGDVEQALNRLGPQAKRALQPALAEYLAQNNALGKLMDSPGGARRLLSSTRELSDQIRHPDIAQAIWRDLIADVRKGSDEETYTLRLLQLRELQDNLGHAWHERARELRGSIHGGDFETAETILGRPLEQTAQVAWFVFGNADLTGDMLRVGQTQFFSHRIWPDRVRDPNQFSADAEAEFPDELDDYWVDALTSHDRSRDHVYARVELTGPRATGPRNPLTARRPPIPWARELVLSVVEAATYGTGGSRWVLLDGGIAYHGTDDKGQAMWDGTGGFQDPSDVQAISNFKPAQLEGTGEQLETLDLRLADRLADGDQRTLDAIGEARWHRSVRGQTEPAQRVALHVRAFEQALPIAAGEHWNDTAQHYFRELWAWDRFDTALSSAAFWSKFWIELRPDQDLGHLITWTWRTAAHETGVHLDRFVAAAEDIHAALGRFDGDARLTRRAVKHVCTWGRNPALARRRLEELGRRFDTLMRRTLRQRNAIIHGVHTDADVVASVDRFVARLADYIIVSSLRSAAVGEDLSDALQRARTQTIRILWRLEHGTPLRGVWDDADQDLHGNADGDEPATDPAGDGDTTVR
jgi:hypothetical protein